MNRGMIYLMGMVAGGVRGMTQPADSVLVQPTGAETPELGWLVFKAVAMLLLILGLIVVLVLVIKKIWGRQLGIAGDQDWFQIVARAPLHTQHSIALVRVFDRFFLLGITESSISNLGELEPNPQLTQWIEKNRITPGSGAPHFFWSMLKKKIEN